MKFLNGIDMESQKVVDVLNPTSAQDAATKSYVDAHTHSQFTAGAWTNATMGSGVGGTLQYRLEPIYSTVRVKTTARIYATGTVSSGATLATLPAGARPAHEFKWAIAQGAEPTQNIVVVKLATTGVLTIVNASLNGTQANGLVINFDFATT